MGARLCAFLDSFGFEYEFLSATDCYKNGTFDPMLLRALEKFDDIMSDTSLIESEALDAINGAADLAALDAVRVAELGKKGRVSGLMKTLGQMSPEERQEMGPKLNALKNRVADAVEARKAVLEDAALEAQLATEKLDMTLPPKPEHA